MSRSLEPVWPRARVAATASLATRRPFRANNRSGCLKFHNVSDRHQSCLTTRVLLPASTFCSYPMAETENQQKGKKTLCPTERTVQIILHLATMFQIICDNSQKKRVYIFQKDAVNGEYWDCLRLKDLKKYIDGILTYSATNEGDTNWMLDAELVCTWVLFLH